MKKIHIIVVDGATLNPGDLSWEALSVWGSYRVYPRSTPDEARERCRDAEAVITNKVVFDRATLAALPKLEYLGVTATGYNIIDVQAAAERGIVVTNVPTYGTASVAQMVFALLLELTQHVGHHSGAVREGRWSKSDNFCYWDYPLVELAGLTMGVVGCGRIGQATGRLADAFGMKVIGYDVFPFPGGPIAPVTLDELLAQSDVVSLHCPLTQDTQGLVNAARLSLMKNSAFLIETWLFHSSRRQSALPCSRAGPAHCRHRVCGTTRAEDRQHDHEPIRSPFRVTHYVTASPFVLSIRRRASFW